MRKRLSVLMVSIQLFLLWACGWQEPPLALAANAPTLARVGAPVCAQRLWRLQGPTRNIAHRGASGVAPENTIAAGRKGYTAGADAWEFDIRPTADGQLVLMHDRSVFRTTNFRQRFPHHPRSKSYVKDLTWAELRTLDVGSWFIRSKGPILLKEMRLFQPELQAYKREKIPSLADALRFTQRQRWCAFIELKHKHGEAHLGREDLRRMVRLIQSYGLEDQVMVISFSLNYLKLLRTVAPGARVGYLSHRWKTRELNAITRMNFDAYLPHGRHVKAAQVNLAKRAKRLLFVWTVDTSKWMKKYIGMGVNGIITNEPKRLAHQLRQHRLSNPKKLQRYRPSSPGHVGPQNEAFHHAFHKGN